MHTQFVNKSVGAWIGLIVYYYVLCGIHIDSFVYTS